ncbi:MGMT family protein [Arcanobacterium bovis]|uniref:MGMT family protein n=2 Tax=Arcanobacterium bovis TaxID=2529275 RepID=A0A4Q9UZD2_9ACTO|nr:MGMT family protein [Arcanobacterium bovis]
MPAESLLHVTTPDKQPHVVAVAVERVEAAIAAWGRRDATAFDHLQLAPARTDFSAHAREAMCAIPFGSMATYGDLAAEIGNPRASRAIGTACAQNPIPLIVPCHRVVPQHTVDAMRQRDELRAKNGGAKDVRSGVAVGGKGVRSGAKNSAENSELAGLGRLDVGNYAIGSDLKYALLEFEGALG